jgi:NAD(P)-dependent dehydrogenase (short-subunit alcohol dehydrogenase family)
MNIAGTAEHAPYAMSKEAIRALTRVAAHEWGRFGDAEVDVGRAVVALVSDDFAYLTGSTLMLDGGQQLLV